MLLDGALERLAGIRLAIQERNTAEKARLVSRCVAIIDELRNSLDLKAGGEIARNLDSLYDYCWRQLLKASSQNRTAEVDEVSRLLNEIRSAWISLRTDGRAR
jgi:flagellar protein FliS